MSRLKALLLSIVWTITPAISSEIQAVTVEEFNFRDFRNETATPCVLYLGVKHPGDLVRLRKEFADNHEVKLVSCKAPIKGDRLWVKAVWK